jgi:hypothetical protein
MTRRRRNPVPGICRVDQPAKRNHGFFVRVQRDRRIYSGFFADRSYGGRKQAFGAAQAFLAEVREIVGPVHRKLLPHRVGGYGRSGIAGVSQIEVQLGRKRVKYWQARWSPAPYVVRRQVFSEAKYGARKAKQMAIRAREEGNRGRQ